MRRTARVLSAVALAGAAFGVTGTAASADPAAEVSPSTVSPGSSVTVSVSCGAVAGQAPATIDATSQAFDEDTVELRRVPGDDRASGPAYRGTARIAQATDLAADATDAVTPASAWTVDGTCPAAPGTQGAAWSTTLQVDRDAANGGTGVDGDGPCGESTTECGSRPCTDGRTDCAGQPCAEDRTVCASQACEEARTDCASQACEEARTDCASQACEEARTDCASQACEQARTDCASRPCAETRTDCPDRSCADAHGDCGKEPCLDGPTGCATPPCDRSRGDACGGAVIQRGVEAGEGGAFTDSVPALVAGGILIAGALGAAGYRLRHRNTGPHR
ncbi:hypothetical protein ABZT17_34230 [Streptomyces sp. NPDC005648]|uniref:hypothetical protein n=1 Tax=Streptomyces sp. NPDC005648 TaxID=3157044 RepID=UPI0033B43782